MEYDGLVDLIVQAAGLDQLLFLKQQGYRDLFFIAFGVLIGVSILVLVTRHQVRFWRDRAEENSARRDEASQLLQDQLIINQRTQVELHSTKVQNELARDAIADQKIEIRSLKTQLQETIPQGGQVVSGATLRRLTEGQIWSRDISPEHLALVHKRSTIPILAVGNLKGGVGKTTLTANLGATFGRAGGLGKKTLFIDFDFQSSLSRLLNAVTEKSEENRVSLLMDPARTFDERLIAAKLLSAEGIVAGCEFYDSTMNLTVLEDRITLQWLLRDLEGGDAEPSVDIRLILREYLLSPQVQGRYDLVIIDLPPRNSALAYNALCAATHLLIVTRPDNLSSDSIPRFTTYLEQSRESLFPHLIIAGVAVNGVSGYQNDWRTPVNATIASALSQWNGNVGARRVLAEIKQTTAISREAATNFAVFSNADVRNQFGELAQSLHLFADGE